ncbi:MAG: prepilin peptidase [Acidimicrobiales bacterium]
MTTGVLAAACGLLGLAIGSFLNVVIYRVPLRQSVVSPRSRCTGCATELAARDNIPVLSWLILRGKCRTCKVPIAIRYPAVELLTAVLFAAIAVRLGLNVELAPFLLFTAVLIAVSAIDIEHYIVPNRIVIFALVTSVPLLAATAIVDHQGTELRNAMLGSLMASGALFLLHLAYPRGMGMGDVKLALVLGLYLGWLSLGHVLLGVFLGFLLGSVGGIALIVTGLRTRSQHLPFAPFLAGGAMLAVLMGERILDWYLH